jgi:hypothetical protein
MDKDVRDTGNAVLRRKIQRRKVSEPNLPWLLQTVHRIIFSVSFSSLASKEILQTIIYWLLILPGSYFPRITLSKPKGKSLPNVFHGLSCNDNNQQPPITSKSLSTLTDCSSKKSKNIRKGASGDKIDTSGKLVMDLPIRLK